VGAAVQRAPFALDYLQIVHAPRHELLFVRCTREVWVYDLKAKRPVGTRAARDVFTDMRLAPDQSALFAADYAGEPGVSWEEVKPSRLHRFDLRARTWAVRPTPRPTQSVRVVDRERVLTLSWLPLKKLAFCRWEEDGPGIQELACVDAGHRSTFAYDPRTGRVFVGECLDHQSSLTIRSVRKKGLGWSGEPKLENFVKPYTFVGQILLGPNGAHLYCADVQIVLVEGKWQVTRLPHPPQVASRDVAFQGIGYYRLTTGEKLGAFEFNTILVDPARRMSGTLAVLAVSPDGMSVWAIDRDKNVARQFALEGDE
jgi:hypothetical protein